jgi:beta-hydroxylase
MSNDFEQGMLDFEAEIKRDDGGPTFFDTAHFPWTQTVEKHWAAIRGEAEVVLGALELLPGIEELQPDQLDLTTDKRWKVFPLYAYGTWVEENLRRCPATARAIREIPNLQAAMYSVFEPNKSIPSHRGVYGGMLRYHMGIKVPQPPTSCGITVGGHTRHWHEAQSLVFDDSHPHHAWNGSGEHRIILLADFTRPVAPVRRQMNDIIIQGLREDDYVVHAVQRWNAWERVHGAGFDRALEAARERLQPA